MSRPNDDWGVSWVWKGRERKLEGAPAYMFILLLFVVLMVGVVGTLAMVISTIVHLLEGVNGQ